MDKQMKNAVRGLVILALTAAVTWIANKVVDSIFGPDEVEG